MCLFFTQDTEINGCHHCILHLLLTYKIGTVSYFALVYNIHITFLRFHITMPNIIKFFLFIIACPKTRTLKLSRVL